MKPFKAEWCLEDSQVPASVVETEEPREARRGHARRFRGGRRRRPLATYRSRFD